MTNETIETLATLGFNVKSQAEFPSHDDLGANITFTPLGATTILFCNGGQSEYDLLANHGAIVRDVEQQEIGGIPYFAVPTKRVFSIFESIARMRCLCSGDKGKARLHQSLAPKMAKNWLDSLKREENLSYVRGAVLAEEHSIGTI